MFRKYRYENDNKKLHDAIFEPFNPFDLLPKKIKKQVNSVDVLYRFPILTQILEASSAEINGIIDVALTTIDRNDLPDFLGILKNLLAQRPTDSQVLDRMNALAMLVSGV